MNFPSAEMAALVSMPGKSVTRSMCALASGFSQTSSDPQLPASIVHPCESPQHGKQLRRLPKLFAQYACASVVLFDFTRAESLGGHQRGSETGPQRELALALVLSIGQRRQDVESLREVRHGFEVRRPLPKRPRWAQPAAAAILQGGSS